MPFFRSELMTHCQILLHSESAFQCMTELGNQGLVHFVDPASDKQLSPRFVYEVKRCIEMDGILKYLYKEIDSLKFNIVLYPEVDTDDPVMIGDISRLESTLVSIIDELNIVETHCEAMRSRYNHLVERLAVITRASDFLTGDCYTQAVMAFTDSIIMTLITDDSRKSSSKYSKELRLGYFAGSIPAERLNSFEIMLWRTVHSNFCLKFEEIPEPLMDPHNPQFLMRKYAFVIFFLGEEMGAKISKVCMGFQVNLYKCPDSLHERYAICQRVNVAIEEVKRILVITDDHRKGILNVAAADIYIWTAKLRRIMMIYVQLSKMKAVDEVNNEKYMYIDCWIPTKKVRHVHTALRRCIKRNELTNRTYMFPPMLIAKRSTSMDAPTYFSLNKFTRGFQALVHAYGVASYREINPAPFTIITFPFLFGVMFGDIGHGVIMIAFAYYLIIREKKFEYSKRYQRYANEIFNLIFDGRYVILLMGFFSIYCGFIYNDIFSKALNILGSHWKVNYNESTIATNKFLQLDPNKKINYLGSPYYFGVDPVWKASGEHAIIMSNSMKMKMAIVLGIVQMLFGLTLGARNCSFSERFIDLYLVIIPQIIFFVCLFGYLIFLILYKWFSFGGLKQSPRNSACAPSLLITFIDMVLFRPVENPPLGCLLDEDFEGQALVQLTLVFVAICAIPVMLVGKPVHFMYQKKSIQRIKDSQVKKIVERHTIEEVRKSLLYNVDYSDGKKKQEMDVDMIELCIHQGIHCIESVLGSISHTASYLRLWALSLAHEQLSHVLWKLVFSKGFVNDYGYFSGPVIWALFSAWAVLTVAILVIMEGLSAFLHTLRLHWVEFQSKFYEGIGHPYQPFYFGVTLPYQV